MILVNFGPLFWAAQIFDRGYLGHLAIRQDSCRIATKFCMVRPGVWPIDISSPNLVNFDSGVRRCHAARCISASLMHLFKLLYDCNTP